MTNHTTEQCIQWVDFSSWDSVQDLPTGEALLFEVSKPDPVFPKSNTQRVFIVCYFFMCSEGAVNCGVPTPFIYEECEPIRYARLEVSSEVE